MKYLLFAFILSSVTICFAGENPYVSSNVGDWVKMRVITEVNDKKYTVITTETVVEKNEKEVVVSIKKERDGKSRLYRSVIPLDEPYNPYGLLTGEKVEILNRGEEVLNINNEKLRCSWVEFKNPTDNCKFWYNEQIPLSGVVKSVMSGKAIVSSELISYGYGKK